MDILWDNPPYMMPFKLSCIYYSELDLPPGPPSSCSGRLQRAEDVRHREAEISRDPHSQWRLHNSGRLSTMWQEKGRDEASMPFVTLSSIWPAEISRRQYSGPLPHMKSVYQFAFIITNRYSNRTWEISTDIIITSYFTTIVFDS